jgi:hypothetical protein
MRDIRSDLIERRDSTRTKRQKLEEAIERLKDEEAMYEKLLAAENAMFEKLTSPLFSEGEQPSSVLSQVLLEALRSKGGAAWLEELKESAVERGVAFGEKKPGRVIHFAMLGMEQHNLVAREDTGRWKLVEQPVN